MEKVLLYGGGENYVRALEAAGIGVCWEIGEDCDGLVLPGGGDIIGVLDEEEYLLIQYYIDRRCPVLGICRGMQALNVYFGGTLRYVGGHRIPEGDLLHPVICGGVAARLLGREVVVTSNHHQAVRLLGRGLQAVQRSEDGTIEGIAHETLPVWGVQWHPERQSYDLRRRDALDAAPLWEAFAAQLRSRA